MARSSHERRSLSVGTGDDGLKPGDPDRDGTGRASDAQPGPAGAAPRLAPGLHLVSTPIGNLGDLSRRARETLAGAALVLAEDTRVAAKLLALSGISRPVERCDDHVGERLAGRIQALAAEGRAVALVSDAGAPLVSDPGYKLVRALIAAGAPVTAVPGPSAVIAALQLSGLPPDRFLFAGFAPTKPGARARWWAELAAVPATLVAFETGPRLADSLAAALAALGDRPAAVARELTKRFEEVRRGPLSELARAYAAEGPPKGEIALVIGGPPAAAPDDADLDTALRRALAEHGVRQAADLAAAATGASRRAAYQRALALQAEAAEGEA